MEGVEGKYSDLEARFAQLQAQYTALKNAPAASGGTSTAAADRKRKQEEMFAKIRGFSGQFDWGRIGNGSLEDKDNLKRLDGLGASVEKKLNALGIYNFKQVANLTGDDEAKLNDILGLSKNKFQNSKWVLNSKLILGLVSQEDVVLDRVRGRRGWLNFDKIGTASMEEKDDLQKINGIGPFIEDKLNVLGIFTFAQMAKFSKRDVSLVNDAIELLEGHMDRDDWVGQAKKFLKG